MAAKWAATMTEKYDELSTQEPIFGQLRNVMDLSVVAALLESEGLFAKAGLDAEALLQAGQSALTEKWAVPKTVASQSSFIKKGRNYIITASGGVAIESWSAASKNQVVPSLRSRDKAAAGSNDLWRWN